MTTDKIERAQVLGTLYRGPVFQTNDKLWRLLLKHQHEIRRHLADWGGDLLLDEAEGYARVTELAVEEEIREQLPTVIEKRPLNYPTTLLAVLLRKQLIEHQRVSSETLLRVSRADLLDQLSHFLNAGQTDEVKLRNRAEEAINTLENYGLLRRLNGEIEAFEVRRLLNSFVDLDFIHEFEEKLRQHALVYFKQPD